MNRLLSIVLLGVLGTLLLGCRHSSQPAAVTPTSASGGPAPAGVVAMPSDTPVKTVLEKAGKGSGKQGRSLDQHEGIYVTPVKALFSTKETIVFDFQVKPAIDRYKAYEGHAPKNHEEFMEKIIKENSIKLPELPEGHKYVYDPMTETLMVEKPAP